MYSHPNHTLYIKNMVCPRCILAVKSELERLGLHPVRIELGFAVLEEEIGESLTRSVRAALEPLGFALLDDPRMQTVEQIKDYIITLIHQQEDPACINLSDRLSAHFNRDYSTLSKLFSETAHTTIEKYAIAQKIERAKELLTYGELTLNEIADRLGYSSAAYLSTQFKSLTGMTPGEFKKKGRELRKPLDNV